MPRWCSHHPARHCKETVSVAAGGFQRLAAFASSVPELLITRKNFRTWNKQGKTYLLRTCPTKENIPFSSSQKQQMHFSREK